MTCRGIYSATPPSELPSSNFPSTKLEDLQHSYRHPARITVSVTSFFSKHLLSAAWSKNPQLYMSFSSTNPVQVISPVAPNGSVIAACSPAAAMAGAHDITASPLSTHEEPKVIQAAISS